MKLAPHWFCVLVSAGRKVAKERNIDYDDALVKEAAELHAEAERRLGDELRRLVERETRK